jgi:N-methylhydantoinase B/oxoprolinase/acetone carboxylase alpha subunit
MNPGDVFVIETPGGGGWGKKPAEITEVDGYNFKASSAMASSK